jgi:predicted DNA binding CopG/RHH family protein
MINNSHEPHQPTPTSHSPTATERRHTPIKFEEPETEAAENAAALDVSLHLRISQSLDTELRKRAAAEHIPTSALVRRLLTQAVHQRDTGALTAAEVEEIARRVAREELQRG